MTSLGMAEKAVGQRRGRWLAVFALCALIIGRGMDPWPVEGLRLRLFDLYQQTKPRTVDRYPVTIVDIDEESIAAQGQWPWARSLLADMVARIGAAGARVIGLDVLFAEPDRLSPDYVARTLPPEAAKLRSALADLPSSDRRFADSFKQARVVLGLAILSKPPEQSIPAHGRPTTPILERGTNPLPFLKSYPALLRNIDVLDRESRGRGIVSLDLGRDGVLRRIPVVARIGRDIVPAIAIEMLRVAGDHAFIALETGAFGISHVTVGGRRAGTDRHGRNWIYYSKSDRKRFVSAKDVLAGTVGADAFRDKLVIIGATAAGLGDFTTTPVGGVMAGVEIHTQLIENILSDSLLRRPALAPVAEILATIALGLLIIIIQPRIKLLWMIAFLGLSIWAFAMCSWLAFADFRLLLDPIYPLVSAFLLYAILVSHGMIAEERHKRAIAEHVATVERESKERVQLLLDSTGEALYGIDADGNCTFCNPACLRMLGFDDSADLTGRNMHALTHPRNADGMPYDESACPIHSEFRTGRSARQEDDLVWRGDGTSFPADARSFPIWDGDGVAGAVVTFIDVTAQKEAERAVRDREAKLRDLQRELDGVARASAMSQLASALAHELNQPLTAIMNYIPVSRQAMAAAGSGEGEAGKSVEYLEKALDQARRASGIIKGLRELTETGESAVAPEDINDVVEEARDLVMLSASDGKVRVGLDMAPGLPSVAINKIQIQQVIVNLVRNAIDAMTEESAPEIAVRTRAADGGIEISVADTGPGIPPGEEERIFGPFVSTKKQGMGLGLSICRSIVEAHAGRIWATSNANGGATFHVALPAAKTPAGRAASET